ncbi:hypothetical protein ERO13_D06G118433v2 [Gossypium hirsutum]|uniref:Secreted protein n=1 Tax=Gossypium darwinii TaxID=34276 RepID=A0A5D2C9L3_GOSDA|nr:hypothetical protein ERO13_D06G118433v2 [Gossypium hirsutum]TYG64953.1 hypothetical protein ES288_D06G147200v1 [Gossypium darwinii]
MSPFHIISFVCILLTSGMDNILSACSSLNSLLMTYFFQDSTSTHHSICSSIHHSRSSTLCLSPIDYIHPKYYAR